MKMYEGSGCIDPRFLNRCISRGEWSASRPCRFTPGTHWTGGWVDIRAVLDDLEKIKILDSTGARTPTPRSSSPTTLSRLLKNKYMLQNAELADYIPTS
jgi:hypothetical protein